MGNCLADEPKAQKSAKSDDNLQEASNTAHQSRPSTGERESETAAPPHPQGNSPGEEHSAMMAQAGYAPYQPLFYPGDPHGGYYQPRGLLLLMDPYTGITYEYDEDIYRQYIDNERRYQRRKERKKSAAKHHHDDDDDDEDVDDNGDDNAGDKEGDKKRRHHHRQSSGKKTTENGGPVTSTSEAVTSTPMTQERPASYQPRDVMISYSRSDTQIMQKIKDKLEAEGITVWVDVSSIDAGADFLSKIGEAIIDAKLFVCVLSEAAVKSRYCRDEVALAYVSNTAIYPVNTHTPDILLPLMDTGLKLQLANYNWTSLTDPDTLQENIQALVSIMKADLDDLRQLAAAQGDRLSLPPTVADELEVAPDGGEAATSPDDVVVGVEGEGREGVSGLSSDTDTQFLSLRERNRAVSSESDDVNRVMPEQFWTDHFGVTDYVMWDRFTSAFLEEFREPVEKTFSADDQHQLMDILKRELEVDSEDKIFKYQLIVFCSSSQGEGRAVWQCVQEQARESFAMREVFNMDSSVRVEAIENLGKFRSAAVIDALRDLLTDPDANVRAVATVSLSRTDANDPVTIRHILRMLSDKDRLVREAGCLALGHLQARQAVSKLTHIWRNDVISHVRDAAAAALRQIGGPDVENEMRVTRVLAEEIRTLTELKASNPQMKS